MKTFPIGTLLAAFVAATLLVASPLSAAHDRGTWSVNVGVPVANYPAYSAYPAYPAYPAYSSYPVYASPVYSAPPVIYARPQAVYVAPEQVYYYGQPRVTISPAPVYAPGYGTVYGPTYDGYYAAPRYWNRGHHGHHGGGYYGR